MNSEINKVSDSLEMSNEDRRILKEENGSLRDNVLRLEELVDGLNEKMDRMGEVSMDQEENRREVSDQKNLLFKIHIHVDSSLADCSCSSSCPLFTKFKSGDQWS